MMVTRTPFVEGWDFIMTLGEGAYGEVRLAVNTTTNDAVAVKIIELGDDDRVEQSIKKEIAIHKLLSHDNIVRYYGHRRGGPRSYIFLEYASGGELFDKIEPDKGIHSFQAQKYFRDLITGVEYLHAKGIAHRDLKPENLLLDSNDVLKVSDFGLATIFRFKGVERELESCCGTKPYIAPEVIRKRYYAQPVDVWSCGIILVALLAGELPWDEPTSTNVEYNQWKDCRITLSPWRKLENLSLSLLRKILVENPKKRATVEVIKNHQWFVKKFHPDEDSTELYVPTAKRKRSDSGIENDLTFSRSQPELRQGVQVGKAFLQVDDDMSEGSMVSFQSFSQPTQPENMVISQCPITQSSQGPVWCMVKRMTRFFSTKGFEDTIAELTRAVEFCGFTIRHASHGSLTVVTTDRRKNELTFKVILIPMSDNILVEFRRSKGDGLDFKRKFLKVRDRVKSMVSKKLPESWTCTLTVADDETPSHEAE